MLFLARYRRRNGSAVRAARTPLATRRSRAPPRGNAMTKPPRMATDLLALTLPAVLAIAMGGTKHSVPPPAQPVDASVLARGEYVAKAAGCAGCHTAPDGGAPFAGGLGMSSPFGTIKSSNITPDPRYGIGRYTLQDFDRAVRHGVAPGGKALYPAMPYHEFSKMSDDDMRALYAYLMQRVAPVPKPSEPTDVGRLAGCDRCRSPRSRSLFEKSAAAASVRRLFARDAVGACGDLRQRRGIAARNLARMSRCLGQLMFHRQRLRALAAR